MSVESQERRQQAGEHVGRHASYGPPATPGQQYLAITERALAERWRSLLGWSLGLAAISSIELAVYPSVASSSASWKSMLDAWPEAFRQAFKLDAYTSGPGFLNAELLSMMFPLALVAVALGFASGATAAEEERGTADVLLALPVSRVVVLLAKATAMVLGVLVVAAAGVAALIVGAPQVDLDVSSGGLVAGGLMTALLALVFGAWGLLVGALTGSRAAAIGVGMCLALASFVLNAFAPMADWLAPWQSASPFYWAMHTDALTEGLDAGMAALLAAVCLGLVGAAVWAFRRHDLRSR